MKIQVLGSGCPTCKKLFEFTQKAVKELNLKDNVEYIPDITKIIEMGVMTSPVLAIDGKPVMIGFSNNIDKIKKIILDSSETKDASQSKVACDCGCNCSDENDNNCNCGNGCKCDEEDEFISY
jgi:small redox-active disulfide protein 2